MSRIFGQGDREMNRILTELEQKIQECLRTYLPEIKETELEENGTVYYMNGKNGTEFDWYVNDRLSDFMVFYDDEDKLGAIKASVYRDGGMLIYVYDDQGKDVRQEIKDMYLDVTEEEMLKLAVMLRDAADDKRIWDASIQGLDTDTEPDSAAVEEFVTNGQYYGAIRTRKDLLRKTACVSRKIFDEGWIVGYMVRDEVLNENDSGWSFMAGNEGEEYANDYRNLVLMTVGAVYQRDPAIFRHIDSPVGTSFVRVSPEAFEPDEEGKKIYMEQREH